MSENEIHLEPLKEYSGVHLFIRADERMHGIEAELVSQGKDIQDAKNALKAVEDRVNMGVARTGNENKGDIQDLKTRMALAERENGELKKQLFDKDTGLIKQFDGFRDWKESFSKNVITFFIVQLAGALILWAVKHFR